MTRIHATCVAIEGLGILVRGRAGSGKSDLALRLVDGGARLVADDQVDLALRDGLLLASAPPVIAGLLEVRGIGILRVGALTEAPVILVVDLVAPDEVERLPAPAWCDLLGLEVPRVLVSPFEASAPAKVRLALARARGDIMDVR